MLSEEESQSKPWLLSASGLPSFKTWTRGSNGGRSSRRDTYFLARLKEKKLLFTTETTEANCSVTGFWDQRRNWRLGGRVASSSKGLWVPERDVEYNDGIDKQGEDDDQLRRPTTHLFCFHIVLDVGSVIVVKLVKCLLGSRLEEIIVVRIYMFENLLADVERTRITTFNHINSLILIQSHLYLLVRSVSPSQLLSI